MGRFNWTNGHSKQSSSHKNIFPQEWFNKTSAEPSRQALHDLMKEYATERSDGTNTTRSRSRTGTASSVRSFYARSSSEQPSRHHSRPASRQSNIEDRSSPVERLELASRGLISKGTRLIRKQGNKSTSTPHQPPDPYHEAEETLSMYEVSPTRSSTPGLMYSPRRELTRNISAPFGFQHVTHAEHSDFQNLSKATGAELATEFSAAQNGQEPVAEIKGIPVQDLAIVRASPKHPREQSSISPISGEHDLPMTPPRPLPPPKDRLLSPFSPTGIRPSRSAENFSRPTRSPVPGTNGSPFGDHLTSISLMSPTSGFSTGPPTPTAWTELSYENLSSASSSRRGSNVQVSTQIKPLPLLPASLHIVSLDADSLQTLRNASSIPHTPLPLPDVPEEDDAAIEKMESGEDQVQYQRFSLRHSQTLPSDKSLNRTSVVIQDKEDSMVLIGSRAATPSPTKSTRAKKRISIGLKNIEIHNWEDAIDYSWDHPEDLEDYTEAVPQLEELENICDNIQHETLLVVNSSPLNESSSVTSSPLMMLQSPAAAKPDENKDLSPTLKLNTPDVDGASALQGLGIASMQKTIPSQESDYFQSQHYSTQQPSRRESLLLPLCYDTGLPTTPMSTSSSVDSLGLSESSSLSGTQRSSHSSTGLDNFTQLMNFDTASSVDSWLVPIRLDTIATASSDTSQETVKTGQPPHILGALNESLAGMDVRPTVSPSPSHERGASVPVLTNSNRTSSIFSDDTIKPLPSQHHSRSSTTDIRIKRPLRVSYSLFPSVQTQPQVRSP